MGHHPRFYICLLLVPFFFLIIGHHPRFCQSLFFVLLVSQSSVLCNLQVGSCWVAYLHHSPLVEKNSSSSLVAHFQDMEINPGHWKLMKLNNHQEAPPCSIVINLHKNFDWTISSWMKFSILPVRKSFFSSMNPYQISLLKHQLSSYAYQFASRSCFSIAHEFS